MFDGRTNNGSRISDAALHYGAQPKILFCSLCWERVDVLPFGTGTDLHTGADIVWSKTQSYRRVVTVVVTYFPLYSCDVIPYHVGAWSFGRCSSGLVLLQKLKF